MVKKKLESFNGKHVLLLQGPVGPFFKNFAYDLESAGATVHKINFNGGDWFFSDSANSIDFTGSIDEWGDYFRHLIETYWIDTIILFGDCRQHHAIAHAIASKNNLDIGVFEEGYLRPDFITFEEYGVNGNSKISKEASFYYDLEENEYSLAHVSAVGKTFWHTVVWVILYYFFSAIFYPKFRKYQHHRPLNPFEGLYWIRAIWRRFIYQWRERGIQEVAVSSMSKIFYLVPLQIKTDAQILEHYEYKSIDIFIDRVMSSFSHHAPKDTWLLIKHHPLDQGYHDYGSYIHRLAKRYNITDRVKYIHNQHLPTLLKHAKGCVLVNSTVGLSAIHHNTPLKVCGEAIYDLPGLVYQGDIDTFWNEAERFVIDRELYARFKGCVINHKQLNGNFYKPLKASTLKSGILW